MKHEIQMLSEQLQNVRLDGASCEVVCERRSENNRGKRG